MWHAVLRQIIAGFFEGSLDGCCRRSFVVVGAGWPSLPSHRLELHFDIHQHAFDLGGYRRPRCRRKRKRSPRVQLKFVGAQGTHFCLVRNLAQVLVSSSAVLLLLLRFDYLSQRERKPERPPQDRLSATLFSLMYSMQMAGNLSSFFDSDPCTVVVR